MEKDYVKVGSRGTLHEIVCRVSDQNTLSKDHDNYMADVFTFRVVNRKTGYLSHVEYTYYGYPNRSNGWYIQALGPSGLRMIHTDTIVEITSIQK